MVADMAALGTVPGSRGLVPKAKGAVLDGMNLIATCRYGGQGMMQEVWGSPLSNLGGAPIAAFW